MTSHPPHRAEGATPLARSEVHGARTYVWRRQTGEYLVSVKHVKGSMLARYKSLLWGSVGTADTKDFTSAVYVHSSHWHNMETM
jgi:hypothetical protein